MKASSCCFTRSRILSSDKLYHPFLHSLHVILSFFLIVYISLHLSCQFHSCLNSTHSHHSSTIAVPVKNQSLVYHHHPQSDCNIFSSFPSIPTNKFIFSYSINLTNSKLIIPPVFRFYLTTSLFSFYSFHACRHFYCFSSSFHQFQYLSNSSVCPFVSKLPYAYFFIPHLRKLRFRRHCHFLFFLLLLLSGDI